MLPVAKKSKCDKRKRRSHHARTPAALVACPKCSAAKLPHYACERCGYVNREMMLETKKEEAA